MSKNFKTTESDNTRVDFNLLPDGQPNYNQGSISQYKPNLIDKLGDALPDTGPIGVLKGLYKGTDDNFGGLLPSGRYGSTPNKEKDFGKTLSYWADPYAAVKGAKMAVSGVKIGNKTYGTPIGRLIANSVNPEAYSSKWGDIKRTLTNKEVFKDAVLRDMPQYKIHSGLTNDRLFAWRQKFGLGKPNKDYDRILDPVGEMKYRSAKKTLSELDLSYSGVHKLDLVQDMKNTVRTHESPIDKIWNKFGKHTEDGNEYFHYKNSQDYFDGIGATGRHRLFGSYSLNKNTKINKYGEKHRTHHYYDDWDFGLNRSPKKILEEAHEQYRDNSGRYPSLWHTLKSNVPPLLQRTIGEALTRDVAFKGTAKKIEYLNSNPTWWK